MKTATDYLTIELDYNRPKFTFPDLSSPLGNPMEYFKLASDTLVQNGFRRESRELSQLKYPAYQESFNLISRFLDFNDANFQTPFKEDSEYLYYKVRKDSTPTRQISEFKINTKEGILELIEEGHDFAIVNCFNRNHLHYLDDLEAVKTLIEENKKHEWFDLISLDAFNSTILHGNRNPKTFTYLLNELYLENKAIAKMFLFGENVFKKNAFGEILTHFSKSFENTKPTEQTLDNLKEFLVILGKIDVDKKDEFLQFLDNVPLPIHDGEKYGTSLLKDILNEELNSLDTNKAESPPKKKSKI